MSNVSDLVAQLDDVLVAYALARSDVRDPHGLDAMSRAVFRHLRPIATRIGCGENFHERLDQLASSSNLTEWSAAYPELEGEAA